MRLLCWLANAENFLCKRSQVCGPVFTVLHPFPLTFFCFRPSFFTHVSFVLYRLRRKKRDLICVVNRFRFFHLQNITWILLHILYRMLVLTMIFFFPALFLAYTNGAARLCREILRAGGSLATINKYGTSIFNAQVPTRKLLFTLLGKCHCSVDSSKPILPWK